MATFLQLCQKVARQSGTVDGTASQPTTVTGQVGRLQKIVEWTADAWRFIQNAETEWRWLYGEFTTTAIVNGTGAYTPTDLGLTDFAEWRVHDFDTDRSFSIYKTTDGVGHERWLRARDYEWARVALLRGTQEDADPGYIIIKPDNSIILHPTPDANHTMVGTYRKIPQELTVDGDVPAMPSRFHDVIVDVALRMLNNFDEGIEQVKLREMQNLQSWQRLARDQLPRMKMPERFA